MIERRSFTIQELRVDKRGKPTISGHAAVFNQLSEDLGGFREKIRPGAFSNALRTSDVRALWNHDPNFVLGRAKNHTLELSEDETGLAVRILPPNTTFASDFLESIDRGDVDQMSFGFRVVPDIGDRWSKADGGILREIISVDDLFDVSPVTFPAYPATDVQARSFYEARMQNVQVVQPPTVEENADSLAAAAEARAKNAVLRQQMNDKLYQYL